MLAGLDYGVTTFDSSAGGLGGCPYAPGAAGNLATEDLLYMLNGLGIDTGVSIDAVASASRFIETKLDHALPSRYLQAPPVPDPRQKPRAIRSADGHRVKGRLDRAQTPD